MGSLVAPLYVYFALFIGYIAIHIHTVSADI